MISFDTFAEAQKFAQKNRCAICWGHLNIDGKHNAVYCGTYQEEHRDAGFVTAYYVEKRRQASSGEKVEVNQVLRDIGILPTKTEDEIMKDLGFGG